jgi:hypothetical protein
MRNVFFILIALLLSVHNYAQSIEGNPIEIKASPYITPQGGTLEISGNVANTKKVQSVALKVELPNNTVTNYTIKTNENGAFLFTYKDTKLQGKYKVFATPEDGKITANSEFYVLTTAAISADFQKTESKLTTTIERSIEVFLSKVKDLPKDEGLDERIKKIQDLKIKLGKTKADDEAMASKLKDLLDEWKKSPDAYVYVQKTHLQKFDALRAEVNEKTPMIEEKITNFKNVSKTCELINLTTELFGYISFCLDFKGKGISIVNNLLSDKVLPGLLDRDPKIKDDEGAKMKINTMQKSLIAITGGAAGTVDFLKTGLSGDIGQYLSKILYNKYCDDLKGPIALEFAADFYNNGTLYSTYKVKLTGDLTLRFNKDAQLKSGTEITGEFSGFRTYYNFSEEVENVEPFPNGSVVMLRKTITPVAVDLNSIKNDLGIVVSSIIPGSFKVGVSALIAGDKLKLTAINNPVFDLETTEHNRLVLVLTSGILPVPEIKTFDFPIASNKIMFRVALGQDGHTFDLKNEKGKYKIKTTISNLRKLDDINLAGKLSLDLSSN